MDAPARNRLVAAIALIAFGFAVTYAAADSLLSNTREAKESHPTSLADIAGAAGAPAAPESDALGAYSQSAPRIAATPEEPKRCDADRRCEGTWGTAERGYGAERAVAVIPTGSEGDSDTGAPCTGAACVGTLEQLGRNVGDRLPELPTMRDCTSSIGGEALCFDFGDGNYLVGDSPSDGAAELGFCTSSGYYYVSGPALDGGAGAKCPDGRSGEGRARGGDPPTARDCTSSTGGEATCFDFGNGKYFVSDPFADGAGELGFCAGSRYYYVSAPSAKGGSGAKCPASG